MKKLFLLLLISTGCYSQDVDYIKSLDTVYIYFKEADTAKLKNITFWKAQNQHEGNYRLADKNDSIKGRYMYIHTMERYVKNKENISRRKFLKKNKDKIIDFDFIDRHGVARTFLHILNVPGKPLYIIHEEEFRKKKMFLRRAFVGYSSYIQM